MTEAEFQAAVVHLAALRGWASYHTYDSRRSDPGFPDLVLVHARLGVAFVELKREQGRMSPNQVQWLQRLHIAGAVAYVWRPSNWPEIERFLKDGGPAPVGAGYPPAGDRPGSDRAAATPNAEVPA